MNPPALDHRLIGWLAEQLEVGTAALTVAPLKGATSSSVYRVTAPGQQAALRVLTNAAWLADEPDLARHEVQALQTARQLGLSAPTPMAVREADGEPPCVLMSWMAGQVVLRPSNLHDWLRKLAGTLADVHARPLEQFPWRFRSWTRLNETRVPDWSNIGPLWGEAIDRLGEPPPPAPPMFLHRDFHPTNVLWRKGRVAGIVDWINACVGPPGVDVAHCRGNLTRMFGIEAADAFLAAYRAARPEYRHDGYWDLDVAVGALPDPVYYAPWREFGFPEIPVDTLRTRLESLLRSGLADTR